MARAADAGVGKLLLPNIDSSTAADVLACCDRYPAYCLPMMGLHPTSVKENYREELAFVEKTLDENPGRFVAVGEVGLDLYWDTTFAEQQKDALERQIRMAIDRDLPLSIHCRDAFPELFDVLFKFRGQDKFRGVIHSFSGTHDDALRLLSLDTFMFGGPMDIFLVDSLIIVNDFMGQEYAFHIFSKATGIHVKNFGKRGRGPGELVSVSSAAVYNGSLVAYDANLKKMLIYNLKDVMSGEKVYDREYSLVGTTDNMVLQVIPAYDNFILAGNSGDFGAKAPRKPMIISE